MDDPYVIRDAIVGTPTDTEKLAAIGALGALLARLATAERDLAEARAALMEGRCEGCGLPLEASWHRRLTPNDHLLPEGDRNSESQQTKAGEASPHD